MTTAVVANSASAVAPVPADLAAVFASAAVVAVSVHVVIVPTTPAAAYLQYKQPLAVLPPVRIYFSLATS